MPGLQPDGAQWQKAYSPLLKYEWGPTYESLLQTGQDEMFFADVDDDELRHLVEPAIGGIGEFGKANDVKPRQLAVQDVEVKLRAPALPVGRLR